MATLTRRGVLGLALLLPGCGFAPLYASGPGGALGPVRANLAQIEVGIIPDRQGQLLREALQARFDLNGESMMRKYDLAVAYTVAQEGIGIQPDTSTTYSRVTGLASWTLRAQDPQHATVTSGTARMMDDYNFINNQFYAAQLEFETIQRRLATGLADAITLQLAAYFKQHPTPT